MRQHCARTCGLGSPGPGGLRRRRRSPARAAAGRPGHTSAGRRDVPPAAMPQPAGSGRAINRICPSRRLAAGQCLSAGPAWLCVAYGRPACSPLGSARAAPGLGPASTIRPHSHRGRYRSSAGLPPEAGSSVLPHSAPPGGPASRDPRGKIAGQCSFRWGERGDSNPRHPGPQQCCPATKEVETPVFLGFLVDRWASPHLLKAI
jgi:hypothetical protein